MFDDDVDAAPIVLDDFMPEDAAAKLRNSRTLLTAAALALNGADTERRALLASIELRTTSSQHPVESPVIFAASSGATWTNGTG